MRIASRSIILLLLPVLCVYAKGGGRVKQPVRQSAASSGLAEEALANSITPATVAANSQISMAPGMRGKSKPPPPPPPPPSPSSCPVVEVTNLNVEIVDTNASLKWSTSLNSSTAATCYVDKYTVEWCALAKSQFQLECAEPIETANTSHTARNLRYCTEYVFTIKAIVRGSESAGSSVTGRTSSPKLAEPRSVRAEPRDFALYIHWEPPLNAVCLKHYRITIGLSTATITTVYTNVTVNKLKACTGYKIYINAVNEDYADSALATSRGETAATVRRAPEPSDPAPWVTVNSITIEWTIAAEPDNNCPLTSLVTGCNYVKTDGSGYDLSNGQAVKNMTGIEPPAKVNATLRNLSPYTVYRCSGAIVNVAGNSSTSTITDITTSEDVPSAPRIDVTEILDSRFTLSWERPDYTAGRLSAFELELRWQTLFPTPEWCTDADQEDRQEEEKAREAASTRRPSSALTTIPLNGTVFDLVYLEARPFSNYTARIRARTAAGWGNYSHLVTFQSAPGVPGAVTNLTCSLASSEDHPNRPADKPLVSWALPCSANAPLEYFNVSAFGLREGYQPHSSSFLVRVGESDDEYSVVLRGLRAEYNYTVTVSAKGRDVAEAGVLAGCAGLRYPAGVPPQPDEAYVKSITIDPYKTRRSASSAAVLLPLFPDTNGDVRYYGIMVAEAGYNPPSQETFDLRSDPTAWPNVSSWEDAMLRDFSITYQATIPRWDPYQANYVIDYGHMKAVKYVLGEDSTCKEVSLNSDKRLYCNGPLKSDTWYHVRMRAFTYGGYADSTAFLVKTNAELNVALVIGIVFGILFLGILTTMMLLVRRCSPHAVFRRFLHSDMPGSPVPAPFTRKKFMAHCQQLVDNPGKLSNEFRLLQTLSVDLQMPTNTACLQANRKKNRYSDILPYDFSRVKLEVVDNDPNTDYINASFIRGYTGEDEYIACQGPKEDTTHDFWRMVDQYDVKTIIMLTQLVERGKEKCHQYFPTIRETFSFESMTIRCTSELDFRTYTQRTLVLQKGNKKRSITHLHFKDWPDHGVPEDFDPTIHFCQITRRNITTNGGLAVVHCSAGIGRTGTLIALDILLQHLRDNRKLDVFGTVYRLRHHRINMVQRESQYAYIYNCLRQVLKNPYFLKTYKPPPVEGVLECDPRKVRNTCNSNVNLIDGNETRT